MRWDGATAGRAVQPQRAEPRGASRGLASRPGRGGALGMACWLPWPWATAWAPYRTYTVPVAARGAARPVEGCGGRTSGRTPRTRESRRPGARRPRARRVVREAPPLPRVSHPSEPSVRALIKAVNLNTLSPNETRTVSVRLSTYA